MKTWLNCLSLTLKKIKEEIERENRKRILCTPAFLPEAKVSVFTLVLFAEVYSAGSRVHGLNDG